MSLPCLLALDDSDECGVKLYNEVVRGNCPELFCIHKAVEYARKHGDYYIFLASLVKMAPIDFVPTIDVIDDCEVAATYPIAVNAFYAVEYGILNVPIVNGYALMDLDSYGELVHRWLSRIISNKKSGERAQVQEPRKIAVDIPSAYPPCIKRIIERLASGEEVEHFARFALVAFLEKVINAGVDMKVKIIAKYFENEDDYDPKKTEYQVKHILGLVGGGTRYSTPNCKTMREHGLCVESCGVRSPLQYYRAKVKIPPKKL